jgi:hypothetical protein
MLFVGLWCLCEQMRFERILDLLLIIMSSSLEYYPLRVYMSVMKNCPCGVQQIASNMCGMLSPIRPDLVSVCFDVRPPCLHVYSHYAQKTHWSSYRKQWFLILNIFQRTRNHHHNGQPLVAGLECSLQAHMYVGHTIDHRRRMYGFDRIYEHARACVRTWWFVTLLCNCVIYWRIHPGRRGSVVRAIRSIAIAAPVNAHLDNLTTGGKKIWIIKYRRSFCTRVEYCDGRCGKRQRRICAYVIL